MGKKKGGAKRGGGKNNDGLIWVDPAMIRFQHSKIRPYFSSCGRALADTLDMIRRGDMEATDLPPIQVLVGPDAEDGRTWYFSLNNRRLWVLKRCLEEGLLGNSNNQIPVRIRPPKSDAEAKRYTLENCAVEAKVMRESNRSSQGVQQDETNLATDETASPVVAATESAATS